MVKISFWKGISTSVIMLGLASMFTDASTEIIEAIFPLFIVSLGGGAIVIGLIGGLCDSTISIFKIFSGYLSDKIGKRKPFIVFGYSASSFAKLFLPFLTSWWQVLIVRPIERIGKGFRDPPRDAFLAETTSKKIHGKVFGLHRTLDTIGAVIGSVIAFFLVWSFKFGFKTILIVAAVIAFLALIPLIFVKEKIKRPRKICFFVSFKNLPKKLKNFLFIVFLFALANFSTMFLILRARQFFSISIAVFLYVLFNISYAFFAILTGLLSDKIGRKNILLLGYSIFAATLFFFVFFKSLTSLIVLFALYGFAYAFIVGNERALVADISSKEIGTCLGTYYTVSGLTTFPSSLIAGLLWEVFRPEAAFLFGGIVALAAVLVFIPMKIKE